MDYEVYPTPRKITYPGGTFGGEVAFVHTPGLPEQGYRLTLTAERRMAEYADAAGRRYAGDTLAQILSQGRDAVIIEDSPAIARRGALIDISRDKTPTLATLKHMLDVLAMARINEAQLYVQGYAYEYAGFAERFPGETPITKAELAELAAYAETLGITLIPNMNCFGHMDAWLALPEYNALAECPDGFDFQGLYHRAAGTVDPADDGAFGFVTKLCDDLLSGFKGGFFNANLDEPFELGLGKSAAACEERGKAAVYADYVRKLHGYVSAKGHGMMIWGDVIFAKPEAVPLLPADTVLLDWLYEGAGRFERHAKIAAETGFRFYVCPGSSAWCSLLGRSDNMKANILDAAQTAVKYNAFGMMVTDWGDLGHWQYLPVSYAPYAFAGAYGWNPDTPDAAVFRFLNERIFGDAYGRAAQLVYELGNYYQRERTVVYNTTYSFFALTREYAARTAEAFYGQIETLAKKAARIAEENAIPYAGWQDGMDGEAVAAWLEAKAAGLGQIITEPLIARELQAAARLAAIGARMKPAFCEADANRRKALFGKLAAALAGLLPEHERLWLARNKPGGLRRSMARLEYLRDLFEEGERAYADE